MVKEIKGFVIQTAAILPDGIKVLTSSCSNYDEFKKLPNIVNYSNQNYGKTGWNSDSQIVYYRSDANLALANQKEK